MTRKLYRSRSDRMLLGVCGGLAEYFDLDSTLVRLATVILLLVTHVLGVVVYVAAGLLMPVDPRAATVAGPERAIVPVEEAPAMPELAGARDTVASVVENAESELEKQQ